MSIKPDAMIITCEHAGNLVPEAYSKLFEKEEIILNSHRGIDFGSLELAHHIADMVKAPLVYTKVTRLIIEANRSPENKELFSEFTDKLPEHLKKEIIREYYLPYRNKVADFIGKCMNERKKVFHLSVHSFTPVLDGELRSADIGLLYDPASKFESEIVNAWEKELNDIPHHFNLKHNYPYHGTADGFTTWFRKQLPSFAYAGIELEVNQKYPLSDIKSDWILMKQLLGESLGKIVK